MTDEEQVVAEIKSMIAEQPDEDQIRVLSIAMTLRNILKGNPHAALAFALVGAEEAAKP